jgi:hypothetical protein
VHLERVEPEPRTGELYGNEPGSSFVLVAGPVLVDEPPRFSALILTVSPPDAAVQIVGGPPAAESLLRTLRVDPTRTAERRYHLPRRLRHPRDTRRLRACRAAAHAIYGQERNQDNAEPPVAGQRAVPPSRDITGALCYTLGRH